jgi:hypothetical protein
LAKPEPDRVAVPAAEWRAWFEEQPHGR